MEKYLADRQFTLQKAQCVFHMNLSKVATPYNSHLYPMTDSSPGPPSALDYRGSATCISQDGWEAGRWLGQKTGYEKTISYWHMFCQRTSCEKRYHIRVREHRSIPLPMA